jgi:dihydroneopterin triphosphate diphosphatase
MRHSSRKSAFGCGRLRRPDHRPVPSGNKSHGQDVKVPDRALGTEEAERSEELRRAERTEELRRPESVLVVIHTIRHDCLLLERLQPAGFWQSVTGSLKWGESPAEAAARELVEETGLDPAALRDADVQSRFAIFPEWRRKYAPGVEENLEHLWYLELPERQPVTLNPLEHRAYRWLPLDEAIETVASWTNREALERLRDLSVEELGKRSRE